MDLRRSAATALLALGLGSLAGCATIGRPDPLTQAVTASFARFDASVRGFVTDTWSDTERQLRSVRPRVQAAADRAVSDLRRTLADTRGLAERTVATIGAAPRELLGRARAGADLELARAVRLARPWSLPAVELDVARSVAKVKETLRTAPSTLRLDRQPLAIPADAYRSIEVEPGDGGPNWVERVLYRLRL
ncbi:MAG: hypothetical protein IPM29_12645 [Planctomycetes bacterium]|nr:hypothetical protein [Planctomycetota bacterium]